MTEFEPSAWKRRIAVGASVLAIGGFGAATAGCGDNDDEGALEDATEEVEGAADDAGKAAEDAAGAAEDAAKDVGDKAEDAANDVKDEAEDATDGDSEGKGN